MGSTQSVVVGASVMAGFGLISLSLAPSMSDSGVFGIANLGNTCFLNALLQGFSACGGFMRYLESFASLRACDDEGAIVSELLRLFNDLKNCSSPVSPYKLVSSLSAKFRGFGEQHDSHEVYCVIQEIIEKVNVKFKGFHIEAPTMRNPFLGMMSTEIICTSCSYSSAALDAIFDVSLQVTDSLYESLQLMSSPEAVEGYVCYNCSIESSLRILKDQGRLLQAHEKKLLKMQRNIETIKTDTDLVVKEYRKVIISRKIARLPKILCFHLKWLMYNSGNLYKKDTKMHFPLSLPLTPDLSENICYIKLTQPVTYKLTAVVEHLGGSSGGHYITYKLAEDSWYKCSDISVALASASAVSQAQPYMLFYELAN